MDTSFAGMGACPESTMKSLSNEGEKTGLSKPEKAGVTRVAITGEVNVATGRDEGVMASTEGNVRMTAGNLNVPDKASGELATSIAWPELTLAILAGSYRTYSAITRAIFHKFSLTLGQFKVVEGVSAYSRVFLIKKISQQNKTATNEHVFTYKPS